MDEAKSKKSGDTFRHGVVNKRNVQEKKSKSETTTISSGSTITDPSSENILVLGKSCNLYKSKSFESGHGLHECRSETAIFPLLESQNPRGNVPVEGIHAAPSNSSFFSAKSTSSNCDVFQKKLMELEDKVCNSCVTMQKPQLEKQKEETAFNLTSTQTDETLGSIEEYVSKLNELEKKISSKEKKIKDLNAKIEECNKAKDLQIEENKGLVHQVNLLNRQLKSMYELIGTKNWNDPNDPNELAKLKSKIAELETLIKSLEENKKGVWKKMENISLTLETKERELNAKTRELVEYKNRSTLELCKLINQIDCLQKDAKNQSEILDAKILEAQNAMDDEIVNITLKLEDQYQKDIDSAIKKFQADFQRLGELPKSAIEKLLELCEPNKIDVIAFQKEWERQQTGLELKIASMQSDHNKEIMQLKDTYESKIMFLKTQVESLASQLNERKGILDIFENELMTYKSNSSMNLLRASSRGDIWSLKELYNAELFSQKQVHKLELDIFEEKVKTLSEEILFHAKSEEIHVQEVENAKRMAYAFREKYELLVSEWKEKLEKDSKSSPSEATEKRELDNMIKEFKALIKFMKKSGKVHEDKIIKLQRDHEEALSSYKQDIDIFKNKLCQLERFQSAQSNLDKTIQDLIQTLETSYTKTVEALVASHMKELDLKELEIYSSEKRHSDELSSLKCAQEKDLEELRNKIRHLEETKSIIEKELEQVRESLNQNNCSEELAALTVRAEEISTQLLKCEGIIAVKDETEQALIDRIEKLEDLLKLKEENCKKELEDLVAKFLEEKILSSAKDDLAKELEDKLNESEKMLEKSCGDIDKLYKLFTLLEENIGKVESCRPGDGGDTKSSVEIESQFLMAKAKGEQIKTQLLETLQKMDVLEEMNRSKLEESGILEMNLISVIEKSEVLEEEKKKISEEKEKLKTENKKLLEEIKQIRLEKKKLELLHEEQLKTKNKLEELEEENREILQREKSLSANRDEVLERNEFLEENVRSLNERMEFLITELANNKGPEESEIVSISLQEVRVLYQEEHEIISDMERNTSESTVGCNVDSTARESFEDLWRVNEELKKENDSLKMVLRRRNNDAKEYPLCESEAPFHEKVILKFRSLQSELSEVINERNSLLTVSKSLEKERDYLKEEVEVLKEENYEIRASCKAKIKILTAKPDGSLDEDSTAAKSKMGEMKKEIGKLSDHIKKLSSKVEMLKANNETLLTESHEYLKHNKNLVNELEEAWTQRYEIEDQLAKVRKQNALLNLHRTQLEETNKRISNLMTDGKPSVVSWIKIHETVENIVDEVLALKTSFSDSGSASGASSSLEVPKTTSELKLMAEALHTQLQNKTILCDELIIQKETLEKELVGLEELMKQNDSRILNKIYFDSNEILNDSRKRQSDNKQSSSSLEEERSNGDPNNGKLGTLVKSSESSPLKTLNILKKHMESQAELEDAQFRENLKLEIIGLEKEMQELEESLNVKKNISKDMMQDEEKNLAVIEIKYEEEVLELTKEFEREVEKLRMVFAQESDNETSRNLTEESREKYLQEIEKLKSYFEGKWADLEKRYQEIYSVEKQKKLSSSVVVNEQNRILNEFQKVLDEENKEEQQIKGENFLREFLQRHSEELKSLRCRYEEDVNQLEKNHISEVQKLKTVVLQMKENIEAALKKEENMDEDNKWREEMRKQHEALLLSNRTEYEEKLEKERKRYNDALEEAKEKHEREILALEEFWTEKLSECETKCAIMKATRDKKTEESFKTKSNDDKSSTTNREQDLLEDQSGEKRFEKSHKEVQCYTEPISNLRLEDKKKPEESFCASCLSNQTYFDRMEVRTDDDKLEILQERDVLKEMVSSLRYIVAKLLSFISQYRTDLNTTIGEFDCEETMYKSILVDMNQTDLSVASSNVLYALDLSSIIQEINDNSFLNSSDQVRFELDKCLKQLKKDATSLLTLSCPESTAKNLGDLIKKVEREKTVLEAKVCKVEEMQEEMKKEIGNTKDRLSQWERNLEVISEGYGEEIVGPNNIPSCADLKDKIKSFLGDQPHEISLLDEICKEGDRLQEEWKREKLDLQQQERCSDTKSNGQIDVADKQVHSLKKFLEEQATEREQERESFDKEINHLKESLKAKERDALLQNRTNREEGRRSLNPLTDELVEILESQIKDLTNRLEEVEKEKLCVDTEFQNAVKKIWSLREVIQDLEVQLAEVSERELSLKKRADKLDALAEEQLNVNRELKEELEACKNQNEIKYSEVVKNLEEELIRLRRVADQISPEALLQLKSSLRDIEGILMRKTKDLEQLHVSSASVSCSSPSEDVSLRDQLDATRCSTPDEMCANTESGNFFLPLEEIDRVHEKLARHSRAEEMAMKCIRDLKMQARNNRKAFQEVQTERDVLLEKVDVYLKDNSSLKVRLEEQRCNAGLLQKQLNANLESQINRLEIDVEKLNELCIEKDKQLRDMKEILENTTKALKVRETEAQNKAREENTLITTLRTDLGNALDENQKLEESLDKMKEKLRDSLKMPALIDSMIDEKNAEIDRLEKEVVRLSGEISSLTDSQKSCRSEPSKSIKRIKFSEPDSFGACISSISDQNPSIMRNCTESYSELKHSPFAIRQPFQYSSKLESVSSIGPLQLSPRGTDPLFNWKTSSPLVSNQDRYHIKSPSIKNESNLQKMVDESRFQSEIESKQREISELHLEVDILKRQLVELKEELTTARSQTKEIQNGLESKDEDIRKLNNKEKSLLLTIESLKKKHTEEVEELHNKLSFEHGKVEKVYEEIKALEVKKIEIEEAFLSLKEDYNEKLNGEQRTVEALVAQVKEFELKNEKLAYEKEEVERELDKTSEKLTKDVSDLKEENESLKLKCWNLSKSFTKPTVNAEVQVEKPCEVCQRNLVFEPPAVGVESFKENLEELREEFVRMGAVITERDFSKSEAFSYAIAVKRLLSYVLNSVDELYQELESHRKKVMECSVDDLAFKVQRELVLSAKLDNQLLSSIEANGFASKHPAPSVESSFKEIGGGDSSFVVPKPQANESLSKAAGMCKELMNKITRLESEKEVLEGKLVEQQKVVNMLEENLVKEKERLIQEKERCGEDAKIMELLRVNLEKGLQDIKSKEKDLKKEKQIRAALEKEMEVLKKFRGNVPESKRVSDLNCQLEAQKEKLVSLGRALEEEKKKSQELRLSLEQSKIERRSEKGAQRMFENDLAMLQEQKENLKIELINVRKLLNSRNVEIGLLKRKINLQEIDIKALSLSNDYNRQSTSETSSVVHKPESLEDLSLNRLQRDIPALNLYEGMPSSLLSKMKKLNTCVQRHVKESNEMGETLLYLSQETEQMREMIKKLEEESDSKLMDKTLVGDLDLERRLWALEKGGMVMNIETLKREQEILKRDLIETCKKNEILKLENSELRKSTKEEVPREIENGLLQDRISHLTRKYMRAESYRKALAWQKNYLLITIGDYRRSEEEAWKKIGRVGGGKKKEWKKKGQRFGRFRVVALAVVAIFRMRFVVRRWHRSPNTIGCQPQLTHRKLSPLSSVLNIYNEPINPLSYQTQNIIRSTSKVLRTPPSRDPGLRGYSLDAKKVSDCLESFGFFKENMGTANALP